MAGVGVGDDDLELVPDDAALHGRPGWTGLWWRARADHLWDPGAAPPVTTDLSDGTTHRRHTLFGGHVAADAGLALGVLRTLLPLLARIKGADEILAGIGRVGLVAAQAQIAALEARVRDRAVGRHGTGQARAVNFSVYDVARRAGDALVSQGLIEDRVGRHDRALDIVVHERAGPHILLGEERRVAVQAEPAVVGLLDLFLKLGVDPGGSVSGDAPFRVDLGVTHATGCRRQVG